MESLATTFQGSLSKLRIFFGIMVAIGSSLLLAHSIGILPQFSQLWKLLLFPVLGLVWGVWIMMPNNLSFGRIFPRSNATQASAGTNAPGDTLVRIVTNAGKGSLYFGYIGSVGFAVKLFSTLDDQNAILTNISNVVFVMFFGLLFSVLCKVFMTHQEMSISSNSSIDRYKSPDTDFVWYFAYCTCVIILIGSVFLALSNPA